MPFERLADAIGDYIMRHFVEPRLARTIGFYRAEVKTGASGGKITVKRPYDDTAVALPYTSAAANLRAGDQCVVLTLGSSSNAIVFSDGLMSSLGGGGGGGGMSVSIVGTDLYFTQANG